MNILTVPPLTNRQIISDGYLSVGTGLWGSVLDVGDGTVLKLARRRCAGIGDGLEKIAREYLVLRTLEKTERNSFSIPKALGQGERVADEILGDEDPTLWLHTTKVPGRVRKIEDLRTLSAADLQSVAASIITALVEFHKVINAIRPTIAVPTIQENLRMIAAEVSGDANSEYYIKTLCEQYSRLEATSQPIIIHGDFNVSNILFEGNEVKSLIDFAETRQGFYEEDLAAIIAELPEISAPLKSAFQEKSGYAIDGQRLTLAKAMSNFLYYEISKRLNQPTDALTAKARLDKLLTEL